MTIRSGSGLTTRLQIRIDHPDSAQVGTPGAISGLTTRIQSEPTTWIQIMSAHPEPDQILQPMIR